MIKIQGSLTNPVKVNNGLGVSPSLSVGGRAIRHSLHSAIATLRSNNTSYPSRKKDKRTNEKRIITTAVKEPKTEEKVC